jgi:subtilisin family serine protease
VIFVWSFITAAAAFAHPKKMVAGEYLVKLRSNGVSVQSAATALSNRRVLRSLGHGSLLISKKSQVNVAGVGPVAASVQESDLDYCKQGIAQGVFEHCSPNYIVSASATPSDSYFGNLWGMQNINAPSAWDVSTGSSSVVVAVIDTGVDYNHPDLAANIWTNTAELNGTAGVDDDNNGYIDDIHGWNAVSNNGSPWDDNGHGTHVAGTIGGVGDNGTGIAGVNWNVRIMALKFLEANGSGSTSDAIELINYMVAMKQRGVNVRVANNSWGGGGYSQALADAIAAADTAGIVFPAAAGNDGANIDVSVQYPAAYDIPNVVSVAAIDSNNNLASFSNYGVQNVDIAAPGVSIKSTTPNNTYSSYSGTSMATPHVSGALALLFAVDSSLTVPQAIQRLLESGTDRASLAGLIRTGRSLNLSALVRNQNSPLPTPPPAPTPCGYTAESVAFAPNRAAEAATLLVTDDDAYGALPLAQELPFGTGTVSQLTISTNGVVYFGDVPSGADYAPTLKAPLNALAGIWLDRNGTEPFGVRATATADGVVLYWLSWIYGVVHDASEQFHVKSWAELRWDGTITVWYEFSRPAIESYVQAHGTLGVTEGSSASAVTVSRANLSSGKGTRFVPSCPNGTPPEATPQPTPTVVPTASPSPQPTATPAPEPTDPAGPDPTPDPEPTAEPTPVPAPAIDELFAFNPRYVPEGRALVAGRSLLLIAAGEGTGQVVLKVALNDRTCPGSWRMNLTDGTGDLRKSLPRALTAARRISFIAGDTRQAYSISRSRRLRLTSSLFNSLCDSLSVGALTRRLRR